MYQELRVPGCPSLTLDGTAYDVDRFGMDDGASADPHDARRFLFQLGAGLMIHLYVIQAGGTRELDHFAHSFWTKDCAVAEVDQEEHGPPARVSGQFPLPVVFAHLVVRGAGSLQRFEVEELRFHADERRLELVFALRGEGGPGRLLWSRAQGYRLEAAGRPARALTPEETFTFEP